MAEIARFLKHKDIKMYVCNSPMILGGLCQKDYSVRCDAAVTATKEYDGIHTYSSTGQPLLYLHLKYHTGGSRPHPG